ncbi:MAG: PHP domain-containing protein [Ignavibacteriae bacterium]|nr:PHP domain-containing protein [Ignavibacteriota bacterium]
MEAVADLHSHTLRSDGVLTPEELLKKASELGLTALSITDHDTMDGYIEAEPLAAQYNIELIPGIEISCYENDRDYHVLGYFVDPDNKVFQQHLDIFRREREKRAERIVKRLQGMDLPVHFDDVLIKAGSATIGRPHVAAVMVDAGVTDSMKKAFDRYLGNGRSAYEPKPNFPVSKGIELINNAGGVAVLAHPGRDLPAHILMSIIQSGIDGIEVVHPSHQPELQRHYREIAALYCLIETGGSDFHGNRDYDHVNFGKVTIPYSLVEAMKYHIHK